MTLQPIQQQLSSQGCNAKMNLNTATKEQLMQAYQIGPAFATDLINARPFGSWEEVAKLSGIGKVRLTSLQSSFLLLAERRTASGPDQELPISASSQKTCTLKDLAAVFKLLSGDPIRGESSPNGAASAIQELSSKTASSDLSMLSAEGPRCFLPHTLLPRSLGNYQRVDTFSEGDMVFSADGSMVKITALKVHETAVHKCVQLCAGVVTNEFTESHRVSILRACKRQEVKAGTLRPGDDVFMSGGGTQKLSDVTFFTQECRVYEFRFEPDLPVESYQVSPGAILTHGRGIRRSHKRASFKGRQHSRYRFGTGLSGARVMWILTMPLHADERLHMLQLPLRCGAKCHLFLWRVAWTAGCSVET